MERIRCKVKGNEFIFEAPFEIYDCIFAEKGQYNDGVLKFQGFFDDGLNYYDVEFEIQGNLNGQFIEIPDFEFQDFYEKVKFDS